MEWYLVKNRTNFHNSICDYRSQPNLFSDIQGCVQKFPDWIDNEINNNKHSLRRNTKGYDGKNHQIDSQNSDTTTPSGRELYNLQF
jgi:hypothetical protein